MHSYLRSIGFSDIKNRRQLTPITKEIIAYPTTRNIITVDADTRLVQLTKDFGEGFGISLVGEMDIDNTVSFEYYFPYVRSSSVMNQERIYIEKHGDKESFAGVCDLVLMALCKKKEQSCSCRIVCLYDIDEFYASDGYCDHGCICIFIFADRSDME